LEPLLGPIHQLGLTGINWSIAGGESGPARGQSSKSGLRISATNALQQTGRSSSNNGGGVQKKRAGRALEGRTWDEMPANLSLGNDQAKS